MYRKDPSKKGGCFLRKMRSIGNKVRLLNTLGSGTILKQKGIYALSQFEVLSASVESRGCQLVVNW